MYLLQHSFKISTVRSFPIERNSTINISSQNDHEQKIRLESDPWKNLSRICSVTACVAESAILWQKLLLLVVFSNILACFGVVRNYRNILCQYKFRCQNNISILYQYTGSARKNNPLGFWPYFLQNQKFYSNIVRACRGDNFPSNH